MTYHRAKISPTHIAFTADSRPTVRDCYARALNAGGRPSGPPNYRNNDCSCFNAAVTDLDGHTIEFIFKETQAADDCHSVLAPSEFGYSQADRNAATRSVYQDDDQSVATKVSRTKSRAQTALDLASAASRPTKQSNAAPSMPGLTRSRTEPVTSDGGSKKLLGTLLGAAAGAAVAYAMVQSEQDSNRRESDYARSRASAPKSSRTRSNYEKSVVSKNSGRSTRPSYRERLAIEPPSYSDDDYPEVLSRYKSSYRPAPQRSRTYDAIEYATRPTSSGRSDRHRMKRSSTLPNDFPDYYLEGPKTAPASRHTSRRGSVDDQELKRHDSAVSVLSHRSRRSFDAERRSSASKVSTIKPSRRGSVYESAANYPLPSSNASSRPSAADRPLPSSRATSYMSAAQPQSRMNGSYADIDVAEESDGLGDTKTVVPEDSISCVDFSSRSSKSKSKSGSKSFSRHSSKRSEADSDRTVRPAKHSGSRHSAQTLPVREKEGYYGRNRDGKRSTLSYS